MNGNGQRGVVMYKIIDRVAERDCMFAASLLKISRDEFFTEYDNPFEKKQVYHTKTPTGVLGELVTLLEHQIYLSRMIFNYSLILDSLRSYAAIFRYGQDSKLDVHVDAGINPETGLRKAVTAILYLNTVKEGGELQFWNGSSCISDNPEVYHELCSIKPKAGRLVLFNNDDFAWHSIAPCNEFRGVITVSFMTEDINLFFNDRKKAYFVPRPDQAWTPITRELRDKRASETHAALIYKI